MDSLVDFSPVDTSTLNISLHSFRFLFPELFRPTISNTEQLASSTSTPSVLRSTDFRSWKRATAWGKRKTVSPRTCLVI
jgi:hypothetical protein